ncbi:unnamed protein product [Lepeophtheirus salmonis]|uniref:(salmon louse) hypothetical protein n=1 Tax=Lepeophtheirus salmonis TaxID=72036 RepID=A0A7R8H2W5_LEPSM|nr:unnamed protein product [Lepeophtheirus salmonis]CAF2836451.1 unnamed protein product [Lepeophtheirus salmonis]
MKILHESKLQNAKLAKLEDENDSLEKVLIASKEDNHRMKLDYETRIEELTNQVPTEGQLLALEHRVKSSSDTMWMSRIHETVDDLEASKLTVQQLIKENLCLRQIHTHSVKDHEREMEEITLNFQGKIKHLEKTVQNLEESERPVIAALESEVIKQGLKNSKLQEQIRFLITEEAAKNNAIISKLKAEKASLEKSISSNEEEMKKLKSEGLGLRQQLDVSQAASNEVEDKIRESMRSIKDENEKIKLEFAKEKTSLSCEKDFISKQLEDLKVKYEKLGASKCILEQEAEGLRHSLDIKTAEDKTERAETIACLEVKNSEMEMKIRTLAQMNASLKLEKDSSDAEVLRRLEERELMIKDISSLSKDIVYLQAELDRLHAKESHLVNQLVLKEQENNELKKDMFSYEDQSQKCHNYSKLIKKLRARLEESNNKLEALQRLGGDEEPAFHLQITSQTSPSHTSSTQKSEDEPYKRLKLRYQDLKTRHKKFSKLLKTHPDSIE